jgi:putative monooxygenase
MSARVEKIARVATDRRLELEAGVSAIFFANAEVGAVGFSTGVARFEPQGRLSCHTHECGESITIVHGCAEVAVEGRTYVLSPFDSIHVPAGLAHSAANLDTSGELVAHVAFSSATVTRTLVETHFKERDFRDSLAAVDGAETLLRFSQAEEYELSDNTQFRDLFAKRLGSKGICGGYGGFAPGASLPCHTHLYDESITIVEGVATCLVAGRRFSVSGCDTALVPKGLPHRFINETDQFMAMIWVYAGDEPERVIHDNSLCSDPAKVR